LEQRLAGIGELVEQGRCEAALSTLIAMREGSAGALRAEVFYWLGRAWRGKAGDGMSERSQRDRRRAGVAFMGLVIHYPRHRLAAESLWRAGRLCVEEGRADLAAGLWRELVRDYPDAVPWSHQAAERLEAQGVEASSQPS
jgi:TolA-binding protein